MTGTVEEAVAEIKQGRRFPVYLLHGDEFVAKEGAKAIVEALVPPDHRSLSVEVISEDRDSASVPSRLSTLPLFGGTKVVMVQDSKAFVSKESLEKLVDRSMDAWREGKRESAARWLLLAVAAAGEDEGFVDRAARGEMSVPELTRVLGKEADAEKEQWFREVAGYAAADGMAVPETTGAGLARVYEETIERGIPPDASLILTAEVVDERRLLFKKISAVGFVIDCGVRSRRGWDTQMDPDAARAKVRQMVEAAGKSIAPDAIAGIVERTGFSMRGLESEMDKLLLYVGSRPAISQADVLEVLSSSREANIFDLTNAVSGRDAGRALRSLRSLMAQREPIPQILGVLAGEVRGLIVARGALEQKLGGTLDAGMPFPAFQARILPLLAKEAEGDDGSAAKLLAMKPFRAFNLLKAATRFSLPELMRDLEAIHEADLLLKTSGHPEDLLMERLLLAMCASTTIFSLDKHPGP
ncbi:MAG: DNA polymerase III subunit delta [Candidatus Methylomirabilales bacterium]